MADDGTGYRKIWRLVRQTPALTHDRLIPPGQLTELTVAQVSIPRGNQGISHYFINVFKNLRMVFHEAWLFG